MYHPSEELAQMDNEKYNLVNFFDGRFVSNLQLKRGHLLKAIITEKHFIDCYFQNVQWVDTQFENCNWNKITIDLSELKAVYFKNCTFREVIFEENIFKELKFENCFFEECQMNLNSPEVELINVFHSKETLEKTLQKTETRAEETFPHLRKAKAEASPPPSKLVSQTRFANLDIEAESLS